MFSLKCSRLKKCEEYSPECFPLLIEQICCKLETKYKLVWSLCNTSVCVSKVYLFIKQRNVWYETTLPSASLRSCIPPAGTHAVICKKCGGDRLCGNIVWDRSTVSHLHSLRKTTLQFFEFWNEIVMEECVKKYWPMSFNQEISMYKHQIMF